MVTRISSILFACALVIFMSASTASADDIRNSRHNMSASGTWNTTSNTNRICVFCHTPHGGNATAPVPLWNKNLDTSVVYNYAIRGESFAIGDVTLACLQCHDGTQALDVMINAPGSGGWSGDLIGASQGYTFAEFTSFGTGLGTGEVAYIGTDLRNDHPVSIGFGEGSCVNGTCVDASGGNFNMPTTYNTGKNYTFANGIKIQERPYSELVTSAQGNFNAGDTIGSVECNSCHNPHIGTTDISNPLGAGAGGKTVSTSTGASEMFLRVPENNASGICLTCHAK